MTNLPSNPSENAGLPAYLQDKEVQGKEALSNYVRPSRLKMVQKMSKAPFNVYDPGTLIVVPQMQVLTSIERGQDKGELFLFVPVFFYVEWIQTNPLGKSPFVRERSFDPRSVLAQKAMNEDTWFEPHPDDPEAEVANRECLNYVITPYGNTPMAGLPMVMSFSKANYKDGTTLSSMVNARPTSIFTQVFTGQAAERANEKGEWFGLNFNIPEETPYIPEDEYETFLAMHQKLTEIQRRAGGIQVDYEDPSADEEVTSTEF